MKIQDFFQLPDGRTARLYSLRNSSGFGADITDFGGAIVRTATASWSMWCSASRSRRTISNTALSSAR